MINSVEREDQTYYITLGNKEIFTTLALTDSDVKKWISQIIKQNWSKNKNKKKKKRKLPTLVVGLWAERDIYFTDGNHVFLPKDAKIYHRKAPYNLLVVCVGDQCLLWQFNVQSRNWYTPRKGYIPDQVPKALKDFLSNPQIIVVGLGIDAMVKKLECDTNLLIPKKLELRDLVQQKQLGINSPELAKINLERLAKLIIGPEMEVVKPESMNWWAPGLDYYDYVSNELALLATTQAYLVSHMATILLQS